MSKVTNLEKIIEEFGPHLHDSPHDGWRADRVIDRLQHLPNDAEVHVHVNRLGYIDHACLDAIAAWEKQRNDKGGSTVVEWQELMSSYQRANPLAAKVAAKPMVGAGH